ncbi:MAG: SLBB domain-containing protein [Armatimonadetes bacterium]|nr:SLBB domain-containing protein [Armatimonadota bacterium]
MQLKAVMLAILIASVSISLAVAEGDYRLAADDVIEMNVWREPDLSKKQIQITSEGNITVPYLNTVIEAAGLTQQELCQRIAEEYVKAEILIDPKVEINLIIRHKMTVWVLGQVQRPGVVNFKEGDAVSNAIAEAGSYTAEARLESAQLTRRGSDRPVTLDLHKLYFDGDLSQNYELQEGDVIYIPEDTYNRYYVMGEVMRPGLYFLRDNASVLSAVNQAGGATPRGSLKGTMLIRGDIKNPEKRSVNLKKLIDGDISQDVKLEAGDIVYVPETSKPDWGKISQVLSALTSLGYIRRFGLF